MSLDSLPITDFLDPLVSIASALRAMNAMPLCKRCDQIREIRCGGKGQLQARQIAILYPLENLQRAAGSSPEWVYTSGTFIESYAESEQISSGVNLLFHIAALLQWSIAPSHVSEDIHRCGQRLKAKMPR